MLAMQVLASWCIGLLGIVIKRWDDLFAVFSRCCTTLSSFFNMILNRWAQLLLTAGVSFGNPILSRQYGTDFKTDCASIASRLEIENASVYFSEYVAAGQNLSIPDRNVTCGSPYQAVSADICRIALYVATSNSSGINMEAWLP
jgi:feruloyl esterase